MLVNLWKVNVLDWIKESQNVYIGRQTELHPASKWANPFPISRNNTREEVVRKFEQYLKKTRTAQRYSPLEGEKPWMLVSSEALSW